MAEAFDVSSLAASAPQDYVCGIQSEGNGAGKQEHNAVRISITRFDTYGENEKFSQAAPVRRVEKTDGRSVCRHSHCFRYALCRRGNIRDLFYNTVWSIIANADEKNIYHY